MMRFRKSLRLTWDREHDLASLFLGAEGPSVSCVDAREVGDELVLHYDAEGHCVEVQFLRPSTTLDGDAGAEAALRAAFDVLASAGPRGHAG